MSVSEAAAQSRFINEPSLNKGANLMEQHEAATKRVEAEMTKISLLIEQATLEKIPNNESLRKAIQDSHSKAQEHAQGLLAKDAKIFVSIRARLQFLLRRYKEDRNSIIHGNYLILTKDGKLISISNHKNI